MAQSLPLRAPAKEPFAWPPLHIGRYMLAGLLVVVVLIGGMSVWATTTQLAGAVIAPGTVVVDTSVKKVQHLTGGIVGEILVKDGDKVKAGDLLVRLDETLTRANLLIVSKQLDELAGRSARLIAERDGASEVPIPARFADRMKDPEVLEIMNGERSLFASRRKSREGQKAQLRERISQLKEEIEGVNGQIKAKSIEIELIGKELAGLGTLEEKQLVTTNRINSLKREAARLEGERAQLRAAGAQAKGKIAEIELQLLQIDQELRTDIVKELREIQGKEAELEERLVAAEDQLKRVDIRAPQSGVVHQLAVHTIGGVINPGEPLMLIVPGDDKLVIEAKVAPHDIDQVRSSKTVNLRFPAFNQRTTPEIKGILTRVAADLTREPQTGVSFYVARIEIPDEELQRLEGLTLVPGMPTEAYIKTIDRTALTYLLKPIEDQLAKAFKER